MSTEHAKQRVADAISARHSRRTLIKGGAVGLTAAAISPILSNAAPTHSPTTHRARAQDVVTLQATVWLGDQEFQAMQDLGSRYTESNPNVEIEFINIIDGGPWGRDQLQRMIAGGEAPDIMMMNTGQFEAFGSRGALADLDERVAAEDYDLDIYWPAAVEGCQIEGALYGLPKDISDHVVYINTDLFDEAGLELPENDWTWDDFREVAQQLTVDTDGDGSVDQWGISINNSVWSWGAFVVSNGGEILSDDRSECMLTMPETVEALEFYYGLLVEDGVSIPPGTLPQTPGAGDQFLGAITGMHMAGPWFRPGLVENQPFNWTARLFPRVPGGEAPTSILYTDQWAMSSTTDYADEAWDVLKFLGGTEGQTAWSEIYGSRSITPIQELAESDAWLGYGGEEHRADNQIMLDQLELTQPPPTNFANGAEVENVWNEQLELVMIEQQSVEQAVEVICQSITQALQ